jgi:hypothetical protein
VEPVSGSTCSTMSEAGEGTAAAVDFVLTDATLA